MKNALGPLIIFLAFNCYADEVPISSEKAGSYLGEKVLVCGELAEVSPFKRGVYLTFGQKFPREHLTGVIWERGVAELKERLGDLDRLKGRSVCIRGRISTYKAHFQIEPVQMSDVTLVGS